MTNGNGTRDHLLMQLIEQTAKARDIWRDKMRAARAPLFEKLDMDYLRADESKDGTLKDDIAAQKQLLRDVTDDPAIEAAETPEELKAVWPEALGSP